MRKLRTSGSVGGDWLVAHDGLQSGTKAETPDTAKSLVYKMTCQPLSRPYDSLRIGPFASSTLAGPGGAAGLLSGGPAPT